MKIKKLWIENFRNLKNFEIEFSDSLITTLIGENGTGKSNLVEALCLIFRDLNLELRTQEALPFKYRLQYECRKRVIEIDASLGEDFNLRPTPAYPVEKKNFSEKRWSQLSIKIDDKEVSVKEFFASKEEFLPQRIFAYSSSSNLTSRLAQHFIPYQKYLYDQYRHRNNNITHALFFTLPVHEQLVLLSYFSFPDPEEINFIKKYIRLPNLELDSILFVIKQPAWLRKNYSDDPFWGSAGTTREILEDLYNISLAPMYENVVVPVGIGSAISQTHLYLYINDPHSFQELAKKYNNLRQFFMALDALFLSDLVYDIRVRVRPVGSDSTGITFSELSGGEQQLLTVLGLLKLTYTSETLFLLDEPDIHLHPTWKLEYLKLIEPIVGQDLSNQVILATHDPIVIGSCVKEQVRVLTFEGDGSDRQVTWYQPEKDPRGMGVAALLTSDVYGLRSSLDLETQAKLDRKRELAAKEIEELTETDKEELRDLTAKLDGLGFTYTIRDPLYDDFVEAMTERFEEHPDLKRPVLTKEQREQQAALAREIAAKLKAEATLKAEAEVE